MCRDNARLRLSLFAEYFNQTFIAVFYYNNDVKANLNPRRMLLKCCFNRFLIILKDCRTTHFGAIFMRVFNSVVWAFVSIKVEIK